MFKLQTLLSKSLVNPLVVKNYNPRVFQISKNATLSRRYTTTTKHNNTVDPAEISKFSGINLTYCFGCFLCLRKSVDL